MWALRLDHVRKVYRLYDRPADHLLELLTFGVRRRHKELVAVEDVTFEVEAGTTLGLIGRNGAGKSTLLKMISGNLSPTAGTIEVRGRVSSILELGMGFQPALTGGQNIRINALMLGLRPPEIEERIPKIVAFSELGDAIDRPIATYSSGMVARLAFSILTAVEADVLVLDEALATGDAGFIAKGRRLIEELRSRGSTVILVSHEMRHITQLCDKAVWIDGGRVLGEGPAERVCEDYLASLPRVEPPAHERVLTPTRLLFRLSIPPSAEGEVAFPVATLGYWDVEQQRDLGSAQLALQAHADTSFAGTRENGVDAVAARAGWGEVIDADGREARVFRLRAEAPAYVSVSTPFHGSGGSVVIRLSFRDDTPQPMLVDLLHAGVTTRLGTAFGGGDGSWRHVDFRLPASMRFDTLLTRESAFEAASARSGEGVGA